MHEVHCGALHRNAVPRHAAGVAGAPVTCLEEDGMATPNSPKGAATHGGDVSLNANSLRVEMDTNLKWNESPSGTSLPPQ